MKVERIDVKDGQFGPYTIFSAGGDSYSAFGRHHTSLSRYKVGDEIDFKWEQKGNYKRVTDVNGPGVTSSSSPTAPTVQPVPAQQKASSYIPRDPKEFNVMMATRYALDAIIGYAASTPEEAVALVRKLYTGFMANETVAAKESL